MMKEMSCKKRLGLLGIILALTLSFVFVACGKNETAGGGDYKVTLEKTAITLDKGQSEELKYTVTKNGEADTTAEVDVTLSNDNITYDAATGKITAVKAGTAAVTVTVKGTEAKAVCNVSIPEYAIEIHGGDVLNVNLGDEKNIEVTVKKDGLKVSDKKVNITVTEGAEYVTYTAIGNRIKFEKEGTATVTVALADDPTVSATQKYIIEKSFWSSEYQVNKEVMTITDDSVYFPGGGGNQYFLGVMDGGTKYMFTADLKLPEFSGGQSVGLGHTLDKNNSSMWFGFKKASGESGYRVFIKNYLSGWGKPNNADIHPAAYDNMAFGETVTCRIIRDGNSYWYDLGGLIGTYTTDILDAQAKTWAGVYSQENALTVTNFSYVTDEAEIESAKRACEAECAIFEFVNPAEQVVKGATVTIRAKKICPDGKNPAVVWALDKTEMTAGQDGTEIADGVLTVASGAAGYVTVKATCGGKEDSVRIEILQESLADENNVVTVDGGIILDKTTGAITFPESSNGANASLNVDSYVDIYYAAKLKDTVKGDFKLSFRVTDLKTTAGSYYMVSLGEKLGNLLFTDGGVSLKTKYVERADGTQQELKEGEVTASFEAADAYTIEIAVVGGHYEVTVNRRELLFSGEPVRRIEDYTAERNILITTKAGTSMQISDLALSENGVAKYVILNGNTEPVTDTADTLIGFKTAMIGTWNDNWDGKNKHYTRTYYGELLPAGDFTLSMNVKFNKAMTDTKFAVTIGAWEFHVCNKIAGGNLEGEIFPGIWGGPKGSLAAESADKAFNVTIKFIGSTAYFYIDGKLMAEKSGAPTDRILSFFTFGESATVDGNVTVTDLTATAGAVIVAVDGPGTVQAGTTSAAFVASVVGSSEAPVWTMDDTALTAGTARFDQEAKTVTFSSDAEGYVTVTATVAGVGASVKVTASSQPADQNTAIAESKGGVKQETATGKIIFDDADKNGVTNETAYDESSPYYAILNSAQGVRATIRDNFILEFTVSDYVTTAEYPKLMISLGAQFEQFYVVYKNNDARIEAFVSGTARNCNGGQWINSDYFAGDFKTNEAHTYKIVCEDGFYTVYVDNTEVTGWKENDQARTLFRMTESMAVARNIMFSTNAGTTATVSDIKLSPVTGKEGNVRATYADWFDVSADGDITVTMSENTPGGRDGYHDANRIYSYGAYIPDDCTITMSVTFNGGSDYPDEALLIKFGSDRSIGVIMNNGNAKIEQQYTFQSLSLNDHNRLVKNTVKIKIVISDGYVTEIRAMNHDSEGNETDWSTESVGLNTATPGDQKVYGVMSFATFIYQTPSNKTVTVSGITVTPATGA